MRIKYPAMAGTMESSDVQISVRPITGTDNQIRIDSPVKVQFGYIIHDVAEKVLDELSVEGVEVIINDRGALDATIVARLQTAIMRGAKVDAIDWEVAEAWKN